MRLRIIFCLLFFCCGALKAERTYHFEQERMGYEELERFGEEVKSRGFVMKDHYVFFGEHMGYLALYLRSKDKLGIEGARKLFLEVANDFVDHVNENKAFLKYFEEGKCELKHVRMNIFFDGITAEDLKKGCIEMVENFDGELSYWYYDEQDPGFTEMLRESV